MPAAPETAQARFIVRLSWAVRNLAIRTMAPTSRCRYPERLLRLAKFTRLISDRTAASPHPAVAWKRS
ncbi:hypothetical protein LMG27174_00477 [Paraburkholderia rhynchosiae]|uniref:Transposase DDE domain-containing protein n=1 Tax=Paraburkholderia rhynchosiae TaxID=487049 RepID=A0A6J4ZSM8_9BURK|nr:hypothetical protein LMG27174_00477 [Paraburkholderia rhynchosiae]